MDFITLGGFVVAFIVLTGFLNYRRKKKVEAVAAELGLEFQSKVELLHELNGFDLLAKGRNHKSFNCFGGEADGVAFKIFQLKFNTGHAKRRQIHSQTVALIKLDHLVLPDFQVTAKCFFSKLFSKPENRFEVQDVKFSKKFWTCSTEVSKTRSLFTPDVIRLLLDEDYSVESKNGRLTIHRFGRTVSHTKLKEFLTNSLQLMMQFEDATMNPGAPKLASSSRSEITSYQTA